MTLFGLISKEKITNMCKPGKGEKQCKYLSMSSVNGYRCEKFTDIGLFMGERIDMGAKSDNCDGINHNDFIRGKK